MDLAVPGDSETRSRSPTPPPLPLRRRPSDSSPQYSTVPRRKPVPESQISRVSVIEDDSEIEPSQTRRQKGAYTSIASDERSGYCPPKPFTRKLQIWGHWRQPLRHLAIFLVFGVAAFTPVIAFNTLYSRSKIGGPFGFYDCNLWGAQHGWSFVGIDILLGSFSYGQAKAIDLAWNWLVGRGLAAFMTFVCYRVFTDALMRAVELTALPYQLFASLAFYPTQLDTIWQLLKGLSVNGGWRVRAILIWLLISIIYLSALPSILDACSGYESAYSTDFIWPNGSRTDVYYLENNDNWYNVTAGLVFYDGSEDNYTNVLLAPIDKDFAMWYYSNWSIPPHNQTGMQWKQFYYFESQELNQSWWDWTKEYPFVSMDALDYTSYTPDPYHYYWYIASPYSYQCVADTGFYQWGFSYEWVIVATAINGAWLLGLWIVWVDADVNSQLCKKGRRMGLWRAIADLSEAIHEDLGPNVCAYSNRELLDELRKKGTVKYYIGKRLDGPKHIGLSSQRRGPFRLEWDSLYGKKML